MAERSASELARETLRQLALNRLPPTPENYTRLYEQAAGEPGAASFPQGPLRHVHALLPAQTRSEEHTSELQSQSNLVCRLLLEKKKKNTRVRTRVETESEHCSLKDTIELTT